MMTLAEIVLIERRRQNLNQAELAEKAGLHRNTISALENGNLDIRIGTLGRVIVALGYQWKIDIYPKDGDDGKK